MRFSQRQGYTHVKTVAERESLDEPTRNGLWSVLMAICFDDGRGHFLREAPTANRLIRALWLHFFKLPIDALPDWGPDAIAYVRRYFFTGQWYQALDLLEFVAQNDQSHGDDIRELANVILSREVSAYRFVGGTIAEITSAEEIQEIETAVGAAPPGARIHLQQSISLLADRTNPDYRNSIKESISAVEATLNQLAGSAGGSLTLGEALKEIDLEFHGAFRAALGNLYGYTSDSDGIRHSLLEEDNLDYADAKFMMVSCSAFVNYLLAKRAT